MGEARAGEDRIHKGGTAGNLTPVNTKQYLDTAKDPAFAPNAQLPDSKAKERALEGDLLSVVKRLQQALTLVDSLSKWEAPGERVVAQRPMPIVGTPRFGRSPLDDSIQRLRTPERLPEMDWFIGLYGRSKESAAPSEQVRKALPRWESRGSSRQLMEGVLAHPAFLTDLANFQRWVLSEAKRFVREILPPKILLFVEAERVRYLEDAALADFQAKTSIWLQLTNPRHPFIQRLPDYPHDEPRIEWEQSKELTQYQLDQVMRQYYLRSGALMDRPLSDLAEPDPDLDRRVQQRYVAIRNQAISHALRHYGTAFEKLLPERRAPEALLISFHPMAAIVFNDAKLRLHLSQALAMPIDLVDGALRAILETAFQQLHESHNAFVKVAAGADSEIPWKRLGPVLRSFARAVSLDEPHVMRFAVGSVNEFLDGQTTSSETAKNVGSILGIASLIIGVLILTGGGSAPPTVVALAKTAAVAALVADGVGYVLQATEESGAEVFNRYALVDKAMEEFPEGTLGSDLFAYFVFMALGNMIARSLGRLAAQKAGTKGAEELRKHSQAVLKELETNQVSKVVIRRDSDTVAAAERLAGKAYRGTKPNSKSTSLYKIQQEAIAKAGLNPMSHVPPDRVPSITQEIQKVKAKLDPEVVDIAEQLDVNVVDVVDQAKKLGVEPHVWLLHSTRFRVEAIKRFIQVRSELLWVQRELDEVVEARKTLSKKVHPRKTAQPPEVVEERARLQAKEDALREEKAELMKWWQAAKLTRNIQGMGDWHELWLATKNPHYTMAVGRDNPAFDAVNDLTNGLVSAKSVRIDEIAAVSMKESKDVGVAAGKSAIAVAIKKFDDNLDDALAEWHERFPGKPVPRDIEARPREIELAFLVSEPSAEIHTAIATDLRAYLAKKTSEEAAKYTLKVRYLSYNELMGLNAPGNIEELRRLRWPKPFVAVNPVVPENGDSIPEQGEKGRRSNATPASVPGPDRP